MILLIFTSYNVHNDTPNGNLHGSECKIWLKRVLTQLRCRTRVKHFLWAIITPNKIALYIPSYTTTKCMITFKMPGSFTVKRNIRSTGIQCDIG